MSQQASLPTSIAQHTLEILGLTLTVHVLDDGRRIFETDALDQIIELLRGGAELTAAEADAIASVVHP